MYSVRLAKRDLFFSAAHFITFGGGTCEPLHGHDYQVTAEIHGPLDENEYVFDFLALERALRAIIAPWDHRVLLPTGHPRIRLAVTECEVEARFEDRRWVFPRDECQLLDVPNTTSERLARLIAEQLRAALAQQGAVPPVVRIELTDSFGQTAACELRVD